MPRTTDSTFIDRKNKETNDPIWLYRIATDSDPNNDIFLAEYNENVSFFKDVSTAQVYTAFPITHGGIGEQKSAEIDAPTVRVSNVSRLIQGYLSSNDGLRGRKVTIRQVFASDLGTYSAYVEDVFYIDSVVSGQNEAVFRMTSRLDLLTVFVPGRTHGRTFCPFMYKEEGCWHWNGSAYQAPTGFTATSDDTCDKTMTDCIRHTNRGQYGGCSGVPGKPVYTV